MVADTKRPVNLFVVGSMKSGSTTLHDYLDEHPDIFMSPEKEPGFFVKELWGEKSHTIYEELFLGAKEEKYRGESSTHYTKLPTYQGVAEKIYRYNPDAKILYIVRHPIKRIISHYFHNRRDLLYHGETRPIARAIREDPVYISYSNYALQVEPYIHLFGRNNVYIVVFEKLVTAPQDEMTKIFSWLEIDASVNLNLNKKSNPGPVNYKSVRGLGLLNKLRYSSMWDKISPAVPGWAKNIGNSLAEKSEKRVLPIETERKIFFELRSEMSQNIRKLEKITNLDFSEWVLPEK
jgi:hypothetical protein